MLIKQHIIITSVLGAILFIVHFFSFYEALLFLIGGLIIDLDHIPSYWYYTHDFSLSYKKIKRWCMDIGYLMEHYFVFHTVWFVLFVLFLVQYLPLLISFFYGLILHVSLDIYCDLYWYYVMKKNKRPYRRWI
jgi:hypothetical protein